MNLIATYATIAAATMISAFPSRAESDDEL
jgi:hypothetical protein